MSKVEVTITQDGTKIKAIPAKVVESVNSKVVIPQTCFTPIAVNHGRLVKCKVVRDKKEEKAKKVNMIASIVKALPTPRITKEAYLEINSIIEGE